MRVIFLAKPLPLVHLKVSDDITTDTDNALSAFKVTRIKNGPFRQNCYVLASKNNEALIIDPGGDADRIFEIIETDGLQPLAIINTHGHFDHIGAVDAISKRYNIPFYLHEGDRRLVKSANIYRLLFKTDQPIVIPEVDIELKDEDAKLHIGPFDVGILVTPGHTPGGLCFLIENAIFTGDTLMHSGPGTTKLPGGDAKILARSIESLRELPPDLIVYGGHGHPKSLGEIWSAVDAKD